MNCEVAQEIIVLAVYGELPDDRAHQLEQHLTQCERCRQEMEAVAGLQKAMSVLPVIEPVAESLTVMVWLPVDFSVTVNVCIPASPLVNSVTS